jgi:transposase
MTNDEELEHLRAEKAKWRELLQQKDEKLEQSHQANQTLREGLKQAIIAIESLQEQVKTLEGLIDFQQERIKILEGQQARDSHNRSLPPSFVLPRAYGKKVGKKQVGSQVIVGTICGV